MAAPPGSDLASSHGDTDYTVVKTKRDPSTAPMNKVRPRTKDTPEIVFGKVQKWCTIEHEEPGNNNNQEPKFIYHQVEPPSHQSTSNNKESSSKQEEDDEGDDPQTKKIHSKDKEIDLDDEDEDPRNIVVEIRPTTTRIQENERPAQTTVGAAVDAPAIIEEDEQEE